ncbi:uncharacterized protein si:ch211-189a15.5 [Pristis pectinata]|uniref:uncharacterized protein si:ch211-189a15.5 n=1 Tax=Pristis pectinata TaxID=685728 RepID=UPI00223D8FB0|nr:uncharacterized protein si:ch211-189a15.5 [Pristis pectinata]
MGSCSKQKVYQNFLDFYQKALASGTLSPCTGEEQVRLGRHFLNSVPSSGHRFQSLDFYRLAREFIGAKDGQDPGEDGFRGLSKAFELLEMLAINLYLWPWRKEIKSIKTFTGAFVYFIQPVFPPSVLQEILEKLGYVQKGTSEYVMSRQVNEEEIGQLGFEFFLARAECELMQEMLGQTQGRCEDVVQLRCRQPVRQADCGKHLNTGSARSGRFGEGTILGSKRCSKSDLLSGEDPAQPQFPDTPLPLTETNADGTFGLQAGPCTDKTADATSDPLSSSRRLPPDSIDLYNDYSDAVIRDDGRYPPGLTDSLGPGGLEQCNSLLVLDNSLVENAHAESLGKLSPGQTGPLSLSLYSSSILIDHRPDGKHPNPILVANSPDGKHPRNKHSDALDQKGLPKPEATKQEYPEDKISGKSFQTKSLLTYGGFTGGGASSQKKDYVSTVEIELKNMEFEKLPFPTAETTGAALFHQADHFGASESQGSGLSAPEQLGTRGQWLDQQTQQLRACQLRGVSDCCLCSPVEILAGQPLLDGTEFRDSSTQESGGNVVREPPQSFYIPPGSLESQPLSASSCDVCHSPVCPNCSSTFTAGHCQRLSKDCLQIQELVIGSGSDTYLYVSKLPGQEVDSKGRSTRCNRCKEDGGL